ncbi:MAG: beta-ketoacyl-[acyl-carrier-protein] synthase family protein [Verrucomicrobia bacterium]|nr:beta-ketoacyl-[acyl-carrier-protein] synthase family protein [Verrucomicrobiota bacterium]
MSNNPRMRIAITGIGLVTPVGNDRESTWSSLLEGRPGPGPITTFDASGFTTRIGAEVKGFDFEGMAPRKLLKQASRCHRFALAAAGEALSDAGIRPDPATAHRWGLSVGAGMMSISVEELDVVRQYCAPEGSFDATRMAASEYPVDPVYFCRTQCNAGLALLAHHFGIRGYSSAVHTACASGGQAIGTALKVMRRGLVDRMLVGGFDSMLNPIGLSSFCLLGALSTDNDEPWRASRPFDVTRNGFVLGEGAGFLVLERWEDALARGAEIYAELAGDGNSLSCYRITDSPPDGDGPIQAIRQSLASAGLGPEDIDYVNAHGTSTQMNDQSECAALKVVLGERLPEVSVSSTKGCMGHLIAAAGAVEAAVCALAIRDGIAPVSANFKTPDPGNESLNMVTGTSHRLRIRAALSNSLGFGGSNSCLTFRQP